MSREAQETSAKVSAEDNKAFAREMRQFTGLSASFFRAAAAQSGLAVTDLQVLDILDLRGETSAGQLAELTGLTSGAITRILDRLEGARLVQRERDKHDGRKVLVRLASGQDDLRKARAILGAVEKTWEEVASRYDKEQLAFLLEFLKQSNAQSRQELARAQAAPSSEGRTFSAPLEGQESGRLVVSCGAERLTLRTGEGRADLYQARFEGSAPDVKVKEGKVKEGVVTIRYPRRLLGLGGRLGAAEVALSVAIPWRIAIQGGAAELAAELGGLALAGLEVKGGFSRVHLELPAPAGVSPIQIIGGATEITVRRPVGVPVSVHLKGWVSELVLDEQTFHDVGANARLQSVGFDPPVPSYDLEVTSYSSRVIITTYGSSD